MLPRPFGKAVVEGQRHDIETDIGRALHVVMAAEDIGASAGLADIAGQQQRDATGAHIGGPHRVLCLAHAPDQRRRFLGGEHLGDAFELRARNAAHPFNLLGRPFFDFFAHVVESIDALLDEFLVLPPVLEDMPHHPVEHRNVGAGPQPHIFGRVGGSAREARIDDHEVRPVELLALEQMLGRDRMRLGGITAPDVQRLRVANVVEAVGHRAVAPGIGDAGDRGRVTDSRLMIGVVGAPERSKLAEQIGALVGHFRGAEPIDRIGARFLADLQNLVPDLVDRLLPRDAGPLAVDQLERILEPAVGMDELANGSAFGAMRAAIERTVPARLLADPHVVLHLGRNRAADGAMRADALARGDRRARARRRARLGPAHGANRQGAERRQTRGD